MICLVYVKKHQWYMLWKSSHTLSSHPWQYSLPEEVSETKPQQLQKVIVQKENQINISFVPINLDLICQFH